MSDDTYVHDPDSFRENGASSDGASSTTDRRGWLLIATIFFAFVVAPALIWLHPPGMPLKMAYLVLPLIPAFLLGLVAVFVTTRR